MLLLKALAFVDNIGHAVMAARLLVSVPFYWREARKFSSNYKHLTVQLPNTTEAGQQQRCWQLPHFSTPGPVLQKQYWKVVRKGPAKQQP